MQTRVSDPLPTAPRQSGPHVWVGDDLARDASEWTWTLGPEELEELLRVSSVYEAGDTDVPLITRREFPLPLVGPRLDELRRHLVHGRGFEVVKGWPLADVPLRQSAAAFLGIGAHLGSARSQNAAGHILGHVQDVGLHLTDPGVRIYQTNERQTFHTDSSDVVGLLCVETAASGGESLLVSAAAVYNEMLDRAPALAAKLFEPVATDRRGEIPYGQLPWFMIPVLSWHAGQLTVMIQRQYIDSAQLLPGAPPLDDEMVAALDLFDEIANDPRLHLSMTMEPGDMLFVHNHTLLHDRMGFTNKPGAPRHLLRLWLSVEGDRELPAYFEQRYGDITVGDRGGIVTSSTRLHAPLSPDG